jgi:hypothetical protein
MKTKTFRIVVVSVAAVVIMVLCIGPALAQSGAQLKKVQELEAQEKKVTGEVITRPKVDYSAESLRDPFKGVVVEDKSPEAAKVGAKDVPPPPLTIQGLLMGAKFPQAIINNKVVKTGDTVEGAKIITIEKDGVTVLFEGRQFKMPSPATASAAKKIGG